MTDIWKSRFKEQQIMGCCEAVRVGLVGRGYPSPRCVDPAACQQRPKHRRASAGHCSCGPGPTRKSHRHAWSFSLQRSRDGWSQGRGVLQTEVHGKADQHCDQKLVPVEVLHPLSGAAGAGLFLELPCDRFKRHCRKTTPNCMAAWLRTRLLTRDAELLRMRNFYSSPCCIAQ